MQQHNGTPAASQADSMARALEEYLAAVEAGSAPPREEFLARYPQLADDLDTCLAALHFIGRAAEGPRSVIAEVAEVQPAEQPLGTLGDFRIIREVGRGGMGVVYEAEQITLGRRVALKVLPFAATMDPRQLQRFHNEARAAASLDHPHIVHVHAVGCERAVHFYAMQFIEGQTLAAMITDLRRAGGRPVSSEEQPTTPHVPGPLAPAADAAPRAAASTERGPRDRAYFRRVAEWGIQVAEALDHAHALGIVHRDVKPANLLVDRSGGLWVTDFGLAHVQSDTRLTMTGDLVGTLRYMSPEQALAQRVVIDHRTDVYSLGATLYELLTLEPAFRGQDRQELLRQIAFEEPLAPGRINRAIPEELETIVLKAMEKNPAERYATAKELAGDLRRWLDDRPIQARRPGVVQRLRKWGRRNRRAVAGGLVLLALAAIILGAGNVVIGWSLHRKNEALWLAELRTKELESRIAEAGAERQHSRETYLGSVRAMNSALSRVEELGADPSPTSLRVRDGVRKEGLAFYRDFLRCDTSLGSAADNESGWGYLHLGNLLALEGRFTDAAEAYNTACALFAVIWGAAEGDDAYLREERPGIEKTYREALKLCRDADPTFVAADYRVVRFDSNYLTRSVEVRDEQTGKVIGGPPESRRPAGGPEGSVQAWRQEMALAEALAADHPLQPGFFLHVLEKSVARRVEELRAAGREGQCREVCLGTAEAYERAVEVYERAAEGSKRAAPHDPPSPPPEESPLRTARGSLPVPTAPIPGCYGVGFDLAARLYKVGLPAAAVRVRRRAVAALERSIGDSRFARDVRRRSAADAYAQFAEFLTELGRTGEAEAAYRQAVAHYRVLWEMKPGERSEGPDSGPSSDTNLPHTHPYLAAAGLATCEIKLAVLLKAHDAVGAEQESCTARAIMGQMAELQIVLAPPEGKESGRGRQMSEIHNNGLGNALYDLGDVDGAIAEYREAIRLWEGNYAAHYNLGRRLCEKGQYAEALTHLRRGHELGSSEQAFRRPNWIEEAAEWVKQCERLVELDGKLPAILSGKELPANAAERAEYADVCQKKRLYASATRLFREAIAARPDLVASPATFVRYNAACAAALAGWGAGDDASPLTDTERTNFRQESLDWLRADLGAWRALLDREPDKARPAVAQQMQHWLDDADFNGVRGPDALGKLSESEHKEWQKLWAGVADTLARVQGKTAPEQKPGAK